MKKTYVPLALASCRLKFYIPITVFKYFQFDDFSLLWSFTFFLFRIFFVTFLLTHLFNVVEIRWLDITQYFKPFLPKNENPKKVKSLWNWLVLSLTIWHLEFINVRVRFLPKCWFVRMVFFWEKVLTRFMNVRSFSVT